MASSEFLVTNNNLQNTKPEVVLETIIKDNLLEVLELLTEMPSKKLKKDK